MQQGNMCVMLSKLYASLLKTINGIKIRTKILVLLGTSLIFFILLFSLFAFGKMETVIKREFGDSMIQVLEQINNNIDYKIKTNELSLQSFYSGERINSLVPLDLKDYIEILFYFKNIKKLMATFKTVNEDIKDIRMFSFDDRVPWDNSSIYSGGEIQNERWVKALLDKKEPIEFYWTNIKDGTWNRFNSKPTIYCYTAVFDQMDRKPLAIIRFDVSTDTIFNAVNRFTYGKSGVVFIAKENGDLIYYNIAKESELGNVRSKISKVVASGEYEGSMTADIDGEKEFLVFSKKNKLGWYVIQSIPQEELKAKTNEIRNYITILSLIICIFGGLSAFYFSALITKRLTMLSKNIDNVAQGDFNMEINISGNDEVGQVVLHIKSMVCRIKELVNEAEEHYKKESILLNEKYELEMLKKEAELCALQTQINPHFLYNTLEMIKGLLFTENYKDNIINSIQALSDMFRYNLNKGYIVSIKEEINHLDNYLTIHNFRFDRGVYLLNEIDEQDMNSKIVRFSFEPIVENAIKHGFRNSRTDHHIRICSRKTNDSLIISIQDDGNGIPEEKLKKINSILLNSEYSFNWERNGGLGIQNVNERIKNNFGNKYGITIESSVGIGTTVFITLPKQ
jgi:two-component system, sensor histidine kinase YesM